MGRTPTRRPTALRTPLARWGFTLLAVLALATAQTGPFLITAALAAYGWRNHPRRRPRRR